MDRDNWRQIDYRAGHDHEYRRRGGSLRLVNVEWNHFGNDQLPIEAREIFGTLFESSG
jgi:hypothetical protein